jgi:ketosteroid isomerase-like protein
MIRIMSDHPNARLAREIWNAIARGDADALRNLVTPDLIWRATARGTPWVGEHHGVDAAIDMLARVGEATEVFDADLVDVLASDERVLLIFRVRMAIETREIRVEYLILARVQDHRIAEIWSVPLEPQAIEAFWVGLGLARSAPPEA